MTTPIDHETREKLTADLSRSYSVEAGAGTGKSTLLTARYCHILKKFNLRPEQVVAITFTEKAAKELVSKIGNHLSSPLSGHRISTIHAFCHTVLKRFSLQSNVRSNTKILQGDILRIFFKDSLMAFFYDRKIDDYAIYNLLLGAGVSIEQLKEALLGIYKERAFLTMQDSTNLDLLLLQRDFLKLSEDLQALIHNLYSKAISGCRETDDKLLIVIQETDAWLKKIRQMPVTDAMNMMTQYPHIPSTARLGSKARWQSEQLLQSSREDLESIKQMIQEWRSTYFDRLTTLFKIEAYEFIRFVEKRKLTKNVIDFDDLLIKTRDLVKDEWILQELHLEYPHILVDEFQDTDPLQAEILNTLFKTQSNTTSNPPTLFIVGDPKQAIYRFRGGSIETYRDFAHQFVVENKHEYIQENFRSHKGVLEFVNTVFSNVLGEQYVPLLTSQKISVEPRAIEIGGDRGRLSEGEILTQAIKTLIAQGVNPSDIGVLYPTKTALGSLKTALTEASVPHVVLGEMPFYGLPEVYGLCALIALIATPYDKFLAVAALRSCYCGFSDQHLLDLKNSVGLDFSQMDLAHLPSSFDSDAKDILQKILGLVATSASFRMTELAYEVIHRFNVILKARYIFDLVDMEEKIDTLFRDLQEFENDVSSSLVHSAIWLKEQMTNEELGFREMSDVSDMGAVQLMTIHKSKGLEFDYVFMYRLRTELKNRHELVVVDRTLRQIELGFGSKDHRICSRSYEEVLEKHHNELREEHKRLMYVAFTRAKEWLIYCNFSSEEQGAKHSYLALLKDGLALADSLVIKQEAHAVSIPFIAKEDRSLSKTHAAASVTTLTKEDVSQMIIQRRLELSSTIEIVRPSEYAELFASKTAHSMQSFNNPSAGVLGTAFHRVFQYKPWAIESKLIESICQGVCRELHIPHLLDELLRMVKAALEHNIFEEIRASSESCCEVPITWMSNNTLVEGTLDLLFKNRDGSWSVLDYKTNAQASKRLSQLIEIYTPQIETYVRSIRFLKQSHAKGYLLFVKERPPVLHEIQIDRV